MKASFSTLGVTKASFSAPGVTKASFSALGGHALGPLLGVSPSL
jgi:hypothetical protein